MGVSAEFPERRPDLQDGLVFPQALSRIPIDHPAGGHGADGAARVVTGGSASIEGMNLRVPTITGGILRGDQRVSESWQKYNHILGLSVLRNQYLIMRHGESTANHERRWVAAPESCLSQYGLTPLGREQIRESVYAELKNEILSERTIVISSDYLRARESSEVAIEILKTAPMRLDPRLRERACGEMEGRIFLPDEGAKVIAQVTQADLDDPFSHIFGLESTVEVLDRFSRLIKELEDSTDQQTYLLVCHGDLLRIGLSACAKQSPGENSRFGHISNAAIFHLNRFFNSMPVS